MEESQTSAIKSTEEFEDENESRTIPIWLALFMCLGRNCIIFLITNSGYICACAALFCIWEKKWNYFTALYFIFISLSTIGLGNFSRLTNKSSYFRRCGSRPSTYVNPYVLARYYRTLNCFYVVECIADQT